VQRRIPVVGLILAVLCSVPALRAQTDLDDLMRRVLTRRDENWKKLQQYVLDEREQVEVRGPAHERLWGERREYTWYIRDGYFVRSPLTVNGGRLSEAERLKYEAEYLRRSREGEAPKPPTVESDQSGDHPAAAGVDGLLRQIPTAQWARTITSSPPIWGFGFTTRRALRSQRCSS
jgi:hypothetical protein